MNSVPNNNSTAVEEKSKLLEKLAAQLEEQVRCPVCLEVPSVLGGAHIGPHLHLHQGTPGLLHMLPGSNLKLSDVQNQDAQEHLPPGQDHH